MRTRGRTTDPTAHRFSSRTTRCNGHITGPFRPPFPILLQSVETCRTYALLPTAKADIKLAQRKLQRTPRMRDLLRDAETLDRARMLATSSRNSKRACAALTQLIERGAKSPVATLAAADLQHLDQNRTPVEKPEVESTVNAAAKLRTWTDVPGTYTVRAVLVEVKDGQAVLRRTDGKTVNVPIEKLSDSVRRAIGTRKNVRFSTPRNRSRPRAECRQVKETQSCGEAPRCSARRAEPHGGIPNCRCFPNSTSRQCHLWGKSSAKGIKTRREVVYTR